MSYAGTYDPKDYRQPSRKAPKLSVLLECGHLGKADSYWAHDESIYATWLPTAYAFCSEPECKKTRSVKRQMSKKEYDEKKEHERRQKEWDEAKAYEPKHRGAER